MCLGGNRSGQAQANQAAAQSRLQAEMAKRQAIEDRARAKAEDIGEAVSRNVARRGRRGSSGRPALMTSTAQGFISRFS